MRGPIVATALFLAVMETADWQCQCTGQCGREHRENVCGAKQSHRVRLVAAPADAVPDHQATAATAEQLRAWCPPCWNHAQAAAARARVVAGADAQQSLF